MNKIIICFASILFLSSAALAGDFTLNMTYTRGEKSKDTRSETEVYFVNENEISYDKKYAGRVLPGELDEFKRCMIGEVTLSKVKELASKYSIYSNDAFYDEPLGLDEIGTFVELNISLSASGESYRISLSGDATEVMNTKAYRNVIEFIKELRKIAKGC